MALRVGWNALLHDGRPSGAHRRRVEILRRLLDADVGGAIEVALLLRPRIEPPFEHARLTVVRASVPAAPAALRAAREPAALRAFARAERCVVVLHESFPVPELGGVPVVLTVHDLRALDPAARAASALRRWVAPAVVRRGLARATRVVAPSEATRRAVLDAAGDGGPEVAVIPNAADHLPLPAPAPRRAEGRILCVGHLEERKGSDLLLEAFALLPRRGDGPWLRFAGRGPLSARLRTRARALRVAARVEIAAAEDDAALVALLATAAVVAVPSRLEGFGIPLLEALRLGAPVAAARAAALPEVGGDACLWIDGFEPGDWASALGGLLDDPARRAALGARGPERARAFSWDDSARRLAALLREVAR